MPSLTLTLIRLLCFLATLSSTLTLVNADASNGLVITQPSGSIWWVAKSINVLAWSCANTSIADFTVIIANTDPKILTSPMPIIAIQQNYVCSLSVTQDQANQPAGTGWTILLANPLNNTEVYATSEPFEIKPLGSLYPSQVTPSAGASGGASGSANAGGASPTSGAESIKNGVGAGAGGLVGVVLAGLVAMFV